MGEQMKGKGDRAYDQVRVFQIADEYLTGRVPSSSHSGTFFRGAIASSNSTDGFPHRSSTLLNSPFRWHLYL